MEWREGGRYRCRCHFLVTLSCADRAAPRPPVLGGFWRGRLLRLRTEASKDRSSGSGLAGRPAERFSTLAEGAHVLSVRDYHALRAHAGIAPVTKQSGKSRRFLCATAAANGYATPSIIGLAPVSSMILAANITMHACARSVIPTVARLIQIDVLRPTLRLPEPDDLARLLGGPEKGGVARHSGSSVT